MNYIKEKIKEENLLGYGTGRIVFDLNDGYVAKIPYNNMGILANKLEYEYYKENKDIIAEIKKYDNNIVIQEKLHSIIVIPYEYTLNNNIDKYLKENYPDIKFPNLSERMLNSRVQIGFDKNENIKFFDYEDSKLKGNFILFPFRMDERWIRMFFDYYKEHNILEISEHETFEDHRGFLVDYEYK